MIRTRLSREEILLCAFRATISLKTIAMTMNCATWTDGLFSESVGRRVSRNLAREARVDENNRSFEFLRLVEASFSYGKVA